MCVYCSMGDRFFRYDPPWQMPPGTPYIPTPLNPQSPPWPIDKLKEYLDLLERVKSLEDQLGCPCEPNKADYIGLFRERIEALEKAIAKKRGPKNKGQPIA